MAYIYSLADTWNDGATTFKGISLNVTDSASAAGSLLMDLQVTGAGRFSVTKDGETTFTVKNTGGTPTLSVVKSGSTSVGLTASSSLTIIGSTVALSPNVGGVFLGGTYANIGTGAQDDVRLYRDAANTLALRSSTSAQAFNIYNTYDASNYERGFVSWSGNVFRIGTERAGTGVNRRLGLYPASGEITFSDEFGVVSDVFRVTAANKINWSSLDNNINNGFDDTGLSRAAAGVLFLNNGSTGGAALQLVEQTAPAAPATNGVRIYAEDNGSGKTRLMALFPTGVAQQIAIEP